MNFVSLAFILFLLTLLLLFYLLPQRARQPLLLIASYIFYATWNIPFIAIILLTTSVDYWLSNIIATSTSQSKRQWSLASGLIINLLILFLFKYFNFFLDSGAFLTNLMGLPFPFPQALQILLPLGISFYTFEAISYMVDVYRGNPPAKNWWEYNFYIMYFPHLISGPIVRFSELVHQYREPLQFPSISRIKQGLELIILGYLFKVLIADNASLLADPVFNSAGSASVLTTYLGVLAFTVQIYFDFMGYTHIARGVSLLFNIELPVNFNYPYLAHNISDFWKRWHISLSRWIRDYLYIPLGGSRGTVTKTLAVLLVTMTLCGAWHGAGWTFIIWGAYHGMLLCLCHGFGSIKKRILPATALQFTDNTPAYRVLCIVMTFISVVWGWVLFRSSDITIAAKILKSLLNVPAFTSELLQADSLILIQLIALLLCCFASPAIAIAIKSLYTPLPLTVKTALTSALLLLCWILSAEYVVPFIYFQF